MPIVERIQPDGRLVSSLAAIPIFALPEPGAPLPDHRTVYRTRGSGFLFAFTFVRWADGTYRAYIRQQPPYGTRSANALVTHRNGDAARRPYICWTPAPRAAVDVLKVARHWAERTERYIRYGTPFDR
jgi:hypothetical protein